MRRIAVIGAAGRMGKTLIEAIGQAEGARLTAAIERPESSLLGADAGELAGVGRLGVAIVGDLTQVLDDFDVLIDFTHPTSTLVNLEICRTAGKAMVIRPTEPLPVKRLTKDPAVLRATYNIGRATAEKRLDDIRNFLG